MKKTLLIFYVALLCLTGLAAGSALGQNPVITYPVSNSDIDPDNLVVTGTVGSPGVRQVRVTYTNIADPTDTDFQTVNIPNNSPATRPYSVDLSGFLIGGQTYNILVETFTAANNGTLIGSSTVTNVRAATPTASTVTPVAPATFSAIDPCTGFGIDISPYPGATVFEVLYKLASAANYNQSPVILSNVSATGPYTATIPGGVLQANQNYQLLVTPGTLRSNGRFDPIATGIPTEVAFTTTDIANAAPIITAPVNGATNQPIFPTITVAAYAGSCGVLGTPTVVIDENGDFTGTDVVDPATYSISGANPGPFTVTFNQPLKNGTTYHVRVGFPVTLGGVTQVYNNQPSFTFSTIAGPVIISPLPDQYGSLPTCFRVEVAAYEGAQSVRAQWRLLTNTTFTNGEFANGTGPYEVAVNNLQISSQYVIRIQAFSEANGGGTLLGYTDFTITTNTTVPSSLPAFVYPPTPANGATGITLNPTIRVAPFTGCGRLVQLTIQVFQGSTATGSAVAETFFSPAPTGDQPLFYEWTVPSSLLPNQLYTVRATFTVGELSTIYSSTTQFTTGNFLAQTQVASYYTNGVEVPFINGAYLNSLTQRFRAQLVTGATSYDWDFDDDPNFGSPISFTGQSNDFTFNATANGFQSGTQYYVRVRGVNGAVTGVFPAPGSPAIVNYYNPLFAPYVTAPTSLFLERRRHSLKSTVVPNATHFFFQVAKANPANDANPAADFVEGNYFQNPPNFAASTMPSFTLTSNNLVQPVTNPGGSLFLHTDMKQRDWGVEAIFGYLQMQPQTTYRIRVVAARQVNGEFVQQTDLGSVPIVTFGTNGIPDRAHPILNIANGATNVFNRENLTSTRIIVRGLGLFWDISEYQLQVSETPFTDNSASQGTVYSLGGVTEYDPHFFVPNLKFGTRYYVRARSIGTEDGVTGVPSPWTDPVPGGVEEGISFTTMGMPAPTSIDLRNITSNRAAAVSVARVNIADRYEWTLERTSAPAATYPVKVTDWVNANFGEYLVQGATYRLSVRAFNSAQAGDPAGYSAPITTTFTVNSDAARSSNEPAMAAMAGTAEYLPSVLFPNPFQREASLQINTGYDQVQVRAVNMQGKVMLDKQASGGETVLLGAGWPSGLYVIQILNEQGLRETFRIVKQ